MPSPRPRSTRQAWAGREYAAGAVVRVNPVVGAWRWRYELAGAAALAAGWVALGTAAGIGLAAGLATALAFTACSTRGRRFISARAWGVVTPHRVRVGCAQAWIHTRYGKLPAVLRTKRQPFGESVYLWCRAGTSAADFASARKLLTAACWAHDVRVSRHLRHAQLVRLDVIRREPSGEAIRAPWLASTDTARPPVSVPPPRDPAYAGEAPGEDPHARR